MKKLILLFLLMPFFLKAQYITPLPSGYTSASLYMKTIGIDTLFLGGTGGKFHYMMTTQALKDSLANRALLTSPVFTDKITTPNIYLPATASSTTGIIYKNGIRFIHNYSSPGSYGQNLFIGEAAGNFTMNGTTTESSFNTVVGISGLTAATTAKNNTVGGYQSGYSMTTAKDNSAWGQFAMRACTTCSYNTASGLEALMNTSTGEYNTASSYQTLRTNTTGSFNSAGGAAAMRENTTGSLNSAWGYNTLNANITGNRNSAFGAAALLRNEGSFNTAGGVGSLFSLVEGVGNTAFGYYAGHDSLVNVSNMSHSTFLGFGARAIINGLTNAMALGDSATVNANNTIVIGNDKIVNTRLKGEVNTLSITSNKGTSLNGTGHLTLKNTGNIPMAEIGLVDLGSGNTGSNFYLNTYLNDGTGVTVFKAERATGNTKFDAELTASKFIKEGGTGSQFLMADGSTSTGSGGTITGIIGDVTASGSGSVSATLATVNSNVGSFGSSTSIPSFNVNGKGLITAVSTNAVIAPAGTLTGTTLASNVINSSLTSGAGGSFGANAYNSTTIPTSYVSSITGTANQLIASGSTGAITLSLPQDIGTASAPTFGGQTLTGGNLSIHSSAYGSNGLSRYFGADGNEKLQMGSISNTGAYIYSPASVGLDIFTGGALHYSITSSGNHDFKTGTATFGGTVTAPTFSGALSGNATTATTASNSTNLGGVASSSYALLASPALSGTPTAPTAAPGTNTTQIATMAALQAAITGGATSDTYTPTVTAVSNTSSPSGNLSFWTRIGDIVTVHGSLNVTASSANSSAVKISLPVAGIFSNANQANGTATSTSQYVQQAGLSAVSGENTVYIPFVATSGAVVSIAFSFMYIAND